MSAVDVYVAYKFVKILSTPWKKTDAYKLGIIDDKGKVLKKSKELETSEERKAYTIFHRLIWNVKRLLDKLPPGRTRIGSFVAAMWMLREYADKKGCVDNLMEDSLLEYLEDNHIITKVELQNELFEETFNESEKVLRKGSYTLKNDIDTPQGEAKKGDIVIVKKDTKMFTRILGVPVFKVLLKTTGKELVISHEDIQ